MIIVFEKSDGINNFKDALHLPDDHIFTDAEIEDMKQQRFTNWLMYIDLISRAAEPAQEP